MPWLLIPYPQIDPVLIHLGPFAVRWYALAYIVGILLGWLYARRLIRNESHWAGPAPLTVVAVEPDSFSVSLIPTTLAMTTLGHKEPGALVNLEVDVIAKYVEKLLVSQLSPGRTQ